MNAIRIKRQIQSETLHLPELAPLVGKVVEILVLEDEPAPDTVRFAPGSAFDQELMAEALTQSGAFSRLA